jgi:hypothetical protein
MPTQYPDTAKKMRDGRQGEGRQSNGRSKGQDPEQSAGKQDFFGRITEKAGNFDEELQRVISSRPMAALAAALGFGFAASMVFKRMSSGGSTSGAPGRPDKRGSRRDNASQGVH